jgi:hypothetical protein
LTNALEVALNGLWNDDNLKRANHKDSKKQSYTKGLVLLRVLRAFVVPSFASVVLLPCPLLTNALEVALNGLWNDDNLKRANHKDLKKQSYTKGLVLLRVLRAFVVPLYRC